MDLYGDLDKYENISSGASKEGDSIGAKEGSVQGGTTKIKMAFKPRAAVNRSIPVTSSFKPRATVTSSVAPAATIAKTVSSSLPTTNSSPTAVEAAEKTAATGSSSITAIPHMPPPPAAPAPMPPSSTFSFAGATTTQTITKTEHSTMDVSR